ncbi:MAG: TVP38/TMEM64 family protein [Rhodospirillaceae bacterium]|nr:TVP38/TMEM64 family protein [Rhodospirillaceae bacterium]MBT3494105.1 TVP38/TMEM64 family protein [Rhodospirillaceae bacterium]MBT3778752.1 TVP38/TMEM64 family protein [Rhodospirillaceae bacterium]MBT3977032.1 TVP38/TMEM64 family protein [Rhodospirillaceae bacterium]MBT4170667.1 TVP38/TMEM64 family protein [Rhodospirillaceae bacterium]
MGGGTANVSPPPPLLSLRRLWPLLVLAAGLIGFLAMDGDRYLSLESLRLYRTDLAAYVTDHTLFMALCFLVAYAAMVAFSLPGGLILTIAGGFLFGSILGTALVVVGATLGATVIFLIAKTALGDPLRARAGPALLKMEAGFQENAFNYLLILRLIPLFPFFLVNLVPAFLGVKLRDYILATFIGIIPGTFVFSQVGTGLDSLLESGDDLSVSSIMTDDILAAMIGLALLAALPLLYKFYQARKRDGMGGGGAA